MLGRERVAQIALLVPCGVLVALMAEAWPVTVDDAFISLRHARNWVESGALSFDTAERIEAYSNFGAVVLASAVLRVGGDPVLTAKALGAACALGSLVLTFLLARRAGAGPGWALLGAGILSVSTGMGFWAVSGLETALFALLLTGGVWLLQGGRPTRSEAKPSEGGPLHGQGGRLESRASIPLACALLLLAALTRVEGPVLVAAAIAASALVRLREGQRALEIAREHAWLGVLVAGYGAYFLWRWHYYGHLFPSPIYFKRIGAAGDVWASHTAAFLRSSFPLLLLAGAAPWIAGRRVWIPVAVVAAALVTFASAREQVLEDVSTMAWFDRYFVPVLPCLIAAAMVSLHAAARRLGSNAPRRAGLALVGGFLLVWQLANPAANPIRLLDRSRGYPNAVAARNIPSASYLQQRFGAEGRVVAGDIGLLGYAFRGTLWDLFGLASYDRTLRHEGELEPYVRELLAREPDAIQLCFSDERDPPRPCQHAERVLAAQPDFRAHYERAAEFGRSEFPSAYHVIFVRQGGRLESRPTHRLSGEAR